LKSLARVPLGLWVATVLLFVFLILSQSLFNDKIETIIHEHVGEMFWLFTLIPSIIFCYYSGLRGGLFIGTISVLIQFTTETEELFHSGNVLHEHDFQAFITVIILQILIVFSVGIMADKLMLVSRKLEDLSNIDDLSGLLNRRGFFHQAGMMIDSESNYACLYIDLDDFKPINDIYGHIYGDKVIEVVAKRISSFTKETDVKARIGGDEFVCLLLNANRDTAEKVASRLSKVLSEPIIVFEERLNASSSIGIALHPAHGTTLDLLLRNADKAMYDAKINGKNNYSFFQS
jgi:diguanylate cyclase (GGDEF)-like protein